MAVTGFWPIYKNLKATLDYADNPDKTTDRRYLDDDLYAALSYAENDNKTDRKMYVGGINCSKQNAYSEMIAVQRRFGMRGKVVGYHGIQSFREGEVTPEQAFEIGMETARRMWCDKYQVLVTVHLNTDAELYARTNSAVAAAANAQLEEGFSYSKDAHMMQCPAGYLAMRVEKRKAANGNTYYNYCFSVKKCKACPMRETCKVGKSKCHTYSVTCVNDAHKVRLEFESSQEFSDKMRIRHRIEEKNGEMKTAHGFRRADSAGLVAMRLQAYFTAMVVNMKRITAVISG